MFILYMIDNSKVAGVRLLTEVADEDGERQVDISGFHPLWKEAGGQPTVIIMVYGPWKENFANSQTATPITVCISCAMLCCSKRLPLILSST